MDVEAYLSRLDYSGPVQADYETLCALQAAHMLHVPFENLDIVPLHRSIRLEEAALWEKIVAQKRGGFCYELNGLFAWLLKQLGFEVTYLNARVFNKDGGLGIEFDHLALLVAVPAAPEHWLADVGFGDSFMQPLILDEGEQVQAPRAYRLERSSAGYIVWQKDYDGTWERQYFFDLKPRSFPADYEHSCEYHQRSPNSSFTRSSVISRATKTGRISLQQDRLIITENGNRSEQPVGPEEWSDLLREHFGIVL